MSRNTRNEWFIVSEMFKFAYIKGLNIDELSRVLLTTKYGYDVLSEKLHSEYADGLFMLSGFKRVSPLVGDRRNIYSIDLAICCGYFYKYWFDKGFTDTKEMYRLANPKVIWEHFATLHVCGYDYWVKYLLDLNGGN